jgi:hypothetical protein
VGLLQNWRNVVKDQLHTLHQCGLGKAAHHLILSYASSSNRESIHDLLDIIQTYPFGFSRDDITLVSSSRVPWEGPVMNAIHDFCSTNISSSPYLSTTVVFYFHSKGVSKYDRHWRHTTDRVWTYSRVLYWRKLMEYFTIEHPQLCLDTFLLSSSWSSNNSNQQQQKQPPPPLDDMVKKSVCGSNFEPYWGNPHYSGNFWVATCEYLSNLTPMNLSDPNLSYVEAEMWIGRGYKPDQFVNLWKRQDDGIGFHDHWIQPYEYRFPEDNVSTIVPKLVN